MVSDALIKKLQEIIREEYGRDVNVKEATEIANDLVGYFDLLAKIYHEDKENNN